MILAGQAKPINKAVRINDGGCLLVTGFWFQAMIASEWLEENQSSPLW